MGGGKLHIEVALVVVLATIWWSIPIMPSSAQQQDVGCWEKIGNCWGDHLNRTSEPRFNSSSPFFNATEFLCCPLIRDQAVTQKPCFCAIIPVLVDDPQAAANFIAIFRICGIFDSFSSLVSFCQGSTTSTTGAPTAPLPGSMGSLSDTADELNERLSTP